MRGEEEYSSVDVVEELCVRPGDGTGSYARKEASVSQRTERTCVCVSRR